MCIYIDIYIYVTVFKSESVSHVAIVIARRASRVANGGKIKKKEQKKECFSVCYCRRR